MKNVWKNQFENKDVTYPNEIAIDYCNQLYELTNKLVIAKVEKYDKNIEDMNTVSPLMSIAIANPLLRTKNVEQYLGEVSESDKFTYEMYLTGSNTPNYKYRFCFIENGVYPYPVKIIVDNDIAKELVIDTRITCDTEETYKQTITIILNSAKMKEVIEGLMTINSKINKDNGKNTIENS